MTMKYFSFDQTPESVKSEYRRLTKQFHSDLAGGNDDKFREINSEYEAILAIQNYMPELFAYFIANHQPVHFQSQPPPKRDVVGTIETLGKVFEGVGGTAVTVMDKIIKTRKTFKSVMSDKKLKSKPQRKKS